MEITILDKIIGPEHAPFIIAEMSGNHNQSLERALKIVEAAARSGVHAVKLQTYTASTMTIDCEAEGFVVDDPKSLWFGESLYRLYEKAHTPWEWHKPIIDRCTELGLICFSSPFDDTAVDFLEELLTPAYKIASSEIVDIPLIKKVAGTGKPMIISTGMATIEEIDDAVSTAKKSGCKDIILLKCTTSYPSSPTDSNLLTISDLRDRFNLQVGVSDHTLGIGVAIAGVGLGAAIIEKHFTLDRKDGGVDADFSLDPSEMANLVVESKRAWQSLGIISYGPTKAEKESLKYRRSLYVVKDLNAGDLLSKENVRSIRPAMGLAPKYLEQVFGRSVKLDVKCGTALTWDLLS